MVFHAVGWRNQGPDDQLRVDRGGGGIGAQAAETTRMSPTRTLRVPSLDLAQIEKKVIVEEVGSLVELLERLEHANGYCSRSKGVRLWQIMNPFCPLRGPCEACAQFGGDVSVPIEDLDLYDWDLYQRKFPKEKTWLVSRFRWLRFIAKITAVDISRRPLTYVVIGMLLFLEIAYFRMFINMVPADAS